MHPSNTGAYDFGRTALLDRTTTLLRVVLYARCSALRQAEKELSIPGQIEALHAFARTRGWEVVATFIDEAESASSADRPQFQEMIARARSRPRPFERILVWKLSRFARNREDSVLYKAMLRRAGVELISLHEPVDDSPAGRMLEGILESVDEFYIDNLSQDTVRGMRKNASLGFLNGGAIPTGYQSRRTGTELSPKWVLEPDPLFAPVVQRIFRMALEGIGACSIAATLHAEGKKTRAGRDWSKATIMSILRNEAYTGVLIWGSKRTGRQKDKAIEPVRKEDTHPAIIPKELFLQVQATLEGRRPARIHPRQLGSDYLLSGLLRCGVCGSILIGHAAKSGKVQYYACQKKMRTGTAACASRFLNRSCAEEAVLEAVKHSLLTAGHLSELLERVKEAQGDTRARAESELSSIENQLVTARGKLTRLYEALEAGGLDLSVLGPRIRERKEEVERLHSRREVLMTERAAQPEEGGLSVEELRAWVGRLHLLLNRAGVETAKSFLRAWIQRIEVHGKELRIAYSVPPLLLDSDGGCGTGRPGVEVHALHDLPPHRDATEVEARARTAREGRTLGSEAPLKGKKEKEEPPEGIVLPLKRIGSVSPSNHKQTSLNRPIDMSSLLRTLIDTDWRDSIHNAKNLAMHLGHPRALESSIRPRSGAI